MPLQKVHREKSGSLTAASRSNYKSAQTSTTKLRPNVEMSFDTVKKSRQASLSSQMTFCEGVTPTLQSTIKKRADRSLSKASITKAKI
jgi:hypothetical protein